jgi:lipoyl(octanoyl) transferase
VKPWKKFWRRLAPNESHVNTTIIVMSSEVETSRVVTFKAVPRDSSTSLGMTIFAALDVYHDQAPRSAAMNMAMDEALLQAATVPSIRFYRWQSPALSFGYFGKFANVASYKRERDLVRRWTGGGVVFHGDDLTYAIAIPHSDAVFSESSSSIYAAIHAALRNALVANGELAELTAADGVVDAAAAIVDGESCFANPVPADVLLNGRKIAGAAQRRTRRGLLQQGSIQYVDLGNDLPQRFTGELSDNCETRNLPDAVRYRAQEIVARKYGTEDRLRKR